MTSPRRLLLLSICLALGALLLPPLWEIAARAQDIGPIVADVRVTGARRIPPERVLNEIKTRKGQPYRGDQIRDDARKLDATQWYHSVAVEEQQSPEGIVVVFRVIERATVQEVVYEGGKHLSKDELDALTGVHRGSPMSVALNRKAAQAIERKYHEKGRLLASVELVEGGRDTDTRVVFRITEGPVVKVRDIRFEGNTFVTDARLKTQINSGEEFLGLFGGKYNPLMLEHDVAKLVDYYRTFGFFDVKIRRKLEWNPGYETVDVVFVIDEGVQYLTKKVNVAGNKELPSEILLAKSRLEEGKPFNGHVMQADVRNLQDVYGSRGRLNARIVPDLRFSEEPGTVTVVYQAIEAPPSRVSDIIIIGNTVTRQNVILRNIPIGPGDVLDTTRLREGERNLARLNIFQVNPELGIQPTITVDDSDPEAEYKPVIVNVQEDRTGTFLFGVGYNSDGGATANIVLHERNFDITRLPTSWDDIASNRAFRGAGQEFRVELVPGTEINRFTVSWREPSLFDSPYSLGTSAYYYTRRFDDYDEIRGGGRVSVGRRLSPLWVANASIRAEDVEVRDVPFFAPSDFFEVKGHNTVIAPRVAMVRDTRDNILRPTAGNIFEVAYEHAFGDFTYPIFTMEDSQYWTLGERPDGSGKHVFALRGQLGIAGDDTPLFDRFHAGGFRTLRGFDFRGIGPDKRGFKVGGDFMLLASAEYQFPILASDNFYGVFFVDGGTVEEDVEINDFRVSAGFGLRLIVPMFGPVPIALDWGFPIVKKDTDDREVFSFWVGFFRY